MKMMGCICSARREDAHMHFSFLTIIREYTKHQHSTKKNEENNAHAHTHTQLYTYTNTREEEERTKEQKKAESNTIREALRFSFSHSFFFLLFFVAVDAVLDKLSFSLLDMIRRLQLFHSHSLYLDS